MAQYTLLHTRLSVCWMTHPPPLIPPALLAWRFVFSGLSSSTWGKKVCLCAGLAVETCTWNLSCSSLAATVELCVYEMADSRWWCQQFGRGFNQIPYSGAVTLVLHSVYCVKSIVEERGETDCFSCSHVHRKVLWIHALSLCMETLM